MPCSNLVRFPIQHLRSRQSRLVLSWFDQLVHSLRCQYVLLFVYDDQEDAEKVSCNEGDGVTAHRRSAFFCLKLVESFQQRQHVRIFLIVRSQQGHFIENELDLNVDWGFLFFSKRKFHTVLS